MGVGSCLVSFFSFFGRGDIFNYCVWTPPLSGGVPEDAPAAGPLLIARGEDESRETLCVLNPFEPERDIGKGAFKFKDEVQPHFRSLSETLSIPGASALAQFGGYNIW